MARPGRTFLQTGVQTGVQTVLTTASSAGRDLAIGGTVLVRRQLPGASGADGAGGQTIVAPPAHPARADLSRAELALLLQLPLLAPGHGTGLALSQTPPDPDVSRGLVLLLHLFTVSSASLLAGHDSRKAVQ